MKERLGGKKATTPPPVADAPYKSPKVKKLEREEREKEENERRHKEEAELEERKKEEELRVEAARIDEERRLNETLRRNISLSLRFIFSLVLSLAVALFL
ncbi:unnamed protein product [Nippostrongylus brasiliensis]|uniref:Uncharacterized protein n=1 Tax=Nippostrongylus brasiliensis TaxID=27835 RepID=A0A0N4XQU4_NIPBR|nr:unnamed protein product [Nippostrongylus brasiliensis]